MKPTRQPIEVIVERKAARRVFDLPERTFATLESDGIIVARTRGRGGRTSTYDLVVIGPKILAYAISRKGAPDREARASRDRAQARLAEQTLLMRQGDLLPRVDVEKEWAAEVAAVRTKLLALPVAIADKVQRAATLGELGAVERMLREAVYDVLRELADPNRIPNPPTPGERAVA